jgi:hypothetical protein
MARRAIRCTNDSVRAYIELVLFERILRDTKRNHRAFFERAGLLS